MKVKEVMKKCLWGLLVILMTYLMIQAGRDASHNIWIEGDPTFRFYVALSREILKGIAAILPVWLLSLLGLARSFFGENWFPFAQKIPIRVTKWIMAAAVILLIGVSFAEKVYLEHTTVPFWALDTVAENFDQWQSAFIWTLFYGMLLYIEQWCIRRNESRQMIRKKQIWVTVTIFLMWLILLELSCVDLWYISLSHVDCPNDLEDYYLWWFSLYNAVFFFPLWFFSARKAVRLFKDNPQWLALTTIIPKTITVLIALVATGFMVQQKQECRYWNEWTEFADLPEYGEAAAMGHTFQAMMWGLLLFYMICLLVKQIRSIGKAALEL